VAQRTKQFVFNNAPLLTTITIFIVAYFWRARFIPPCKPAGIFNLFINNAALLIVSIGMAW
jgi:hypothetical protein